MLEVGFLILISICVEHPVSIVLELKVRLVVAYRCCVGAMEFAPEIMEAPESPRSIDTFPVEDTNVCWASGLVVLPGLRLP